VGRVAFVSNTRGGAGSAGGVAGAGQTVTAATATIRQYKDNMKFCQKTDEIKVKPKWPTSPAILCIEVLESPLGVWEVKRGARARWQHV